MGIKAVELVRAIRDRHYEETRLMNNEEYCAYIQAKADTLRNDQVKAMNKDRKRACDAPL